MINRDKMSSYAKSVVFPPSTPEVKKSLKLSSYYKHKIYFDDKSCHDPSNLRSLKKESFLVRPFSFSMRTYMRAYLRILSELGGSYKLSDKNKHYYPDSLLYLYHFNHGGFLSRWKWKV